MILTNKIKTRIFYLLMIIVFGLFVTFAKFSRSDLEGNHQVTTCFIDEVKIVGRERFVKVEYHFVIEGKKYSDDASFNQSEMSYQNAKMLMDRAIPLVYHKDFIRIMSFPLIFPKDYKDFNIPYPDTLNWILPLMKK